MAPVAQKKRGRPTKLDEAAAAEIIRAVGAGAYRKVAAVYAGISERTFREWMAEGKADPKGPYGVFRRNVLEAEAKAEVHVGTVAFAAAARDPAYALSYMRVRWRKRWNPSEGKLEVTGKGGAPLVPASDPTSLLEKLRKIEEEGKGE